ncbi:MAG: class I poly(R)-hydroxyalkanoic acid synthase, partial [Pseudomonadota bacterium]
FDLLYWNADSTRLPRAMLLWYLEQVYLQNKLRQPGGLEMDGVAIDISKITTPVYVLATQDDHIAPWTSIYPTTQILGGDVQFVLGGSGHIAGVINPPSKRMKYGYRIAESHPPDPKTFLRTATQHEGSWWPHWTAWLEKLDGEKVLARKPAKRGTYKSIEPAPGHFVKAS